ncbi:inverse autotransporter beta-barrel domain-containing protein [Halanaerobium hydrogeniformans]|uniref:GLUG domain protein n=1 Tax=Halanaerobium hydrogeniformans TaxID=656519 RepID=E4RPJ2_HALHG|nr:inverse autotransporter beta-barrel domain-containing protein [Halanaerobium hydrogeniformans]ADQ14015.1 hypothetical protein Halsa_0550 [Halanaerobium hydrogeniformans]
MKYVSTIIIALLILLIFLTLASPILAEEFDRAARINLRGITGDDFIAQAGVLYPFRNREDSLWYSDVRYRFSDDDIDEWNLGLGYRRKLDNYDNRLAGAYIFRDRRNEFDHYWDMWTLGGEILTDQWDFRLNAYISDDDEVLAPGSTVGGGGLDVNDNQELILTLGNELYYKSMDGLDLEFGRRFTETDSIFRNVGVYGRLFRFSESDTPTITGRQIRIDKQFGDVNKTNWKLGAMWRDDNVRDSKVEATFAVSIPFGRSTAAEVEKEDKTKADILEARMTEQPERDLDIVVGKAVVENGMAGEVIVVENPVLKGESIRVWYVTGDGEYFASGSKDDPIRIERIEYTGDAPKEGDIIVLSGASGDILLNSGNITTLGIPDLDFIELKDYQQLISKRGYAVVKTEVSGELKEFEFRPNVEQATLKINGGFTGDGAIILNQYNTVSGLDIVNNSLEIYDNNTETDIYKGIYQQTLDVNNAPDIRDNKIENFDIGIFFEEIAGSNNQDKIDNLRTFDTEYEKMNEITGAKIVAVHDHLIRDWYDLNSVRYNLAGVYIMKGNLDSDTAGYDQLASENANENKGWEPLGDDNEKFSGHFDGQVYEISNLYISRTTEREVGLFGYIESGSFIENVGLINVDVEGGDYNVGSLVGRNDDGKIANSYAAGNVAGDNNAGGLVGRNNGIIVNSYAEVDITGNDLVGGLVGYNFDGAIDNSYAAGDVKGRQEVGGLAGWSYKGTIDNSYAVGDVTGNERVGGLIGRNDGGTIKESYATGNVITGTNTYSAHLGGLVGDNENGAIVKSYAEGDVTGMNDVGGLVGRNKDGLIKESYATGNIEGERRVGGLVGWNRDNATLENSYATGNVTGTVEDVGGLVGYNYLGTIENSYAAGNVTGDNNVGGLIGRNNDDEQTNNSYWDINSSGQKTSAGGEGRTIEEMIQQDTFEPEWDFEDNWVIIDGESYPYLQWQGEENIPYPPAG